VNPSPRRWTGLVFALLLGATAGCGSTTSPSASSAPSTGPSSTSPSSISASSTGSLSIGLSEADDGRTVTAQVGDTITVVLHHTTWVLAPGPASAVLAADGATVVAPQLQGCVPGQGCGTITARYQVTGTGQAHLTAHRDSCGEARTCAPGEGDWAVEVTVG